MIHILSSLLQRSDEYFHVSELEELFLWLNTHGGATDREAVFIDLPLERKIVSARSRKRFLSSALPVSFIVTRPGYFSESIRSLSGHDHHEGTWSRIFFSSVLEIWERRERHPQQLPLRFGLSHDEAITAMALARECIKHSFGFPFTPPPIPRRFDEPATAAVAVFVDGIVRSSMVITDTSFTKAITTAARIAKNDTRKKQLSENELERMTIFLSWVSNLRIPITNTELALKFIDGRRAFGIYTHNGTYVYYLPTVFNEEHFIGIADLRDRLLETKANIPRSHVGAYSFRSFLTHGYLSTPHTGIIPTEGPIPVDIQPLKQEKITDCLREFRKSGDHALAWLLSMQDDDGYFPLFFDPIYYRYGKSDPPRMGSTLLALAQYSRATKHVAARTAALRLSRYLAKLLSDGGSATHTSIHTLTYAYLARASLILEQLDDALRFLRSVESLITNTPYEPLCFANIASMYVELGKHVGAKELITRGNDITQGVWNDFEHRIQKREQVFTASYAELVHTYTSLFHIQERREYSYRAQQVARFLTTVITDDGAVPVARHIPFFNTRTCGKIFEVLASNPNEYWETIIATFSWLQKLQFREVHGYCFDKERYKQINGGLRHDYANPAVWIDAAAHFLLGIARVLEAKHLLNPKR